PFDDLAEDAVLAVEPRRRGQRDEELSAVGVRAAVRHREDAGFGVPQLRRELVGERVARAARALAERVAALDHEAGDHAMKDRAVEVRLLDLAARARIGPLLRSVREPR